MTARLAAVVVASAFVVAVTAPVARAGDSDKIPASVTVAFGAGLNTAVPPGGPIPPTPNHHIIPQEITVKITTAQKLDGSVVTVPATVNFIVSGFHEIWVYNPGVEVSEIVVPGSGTFVNYDVEVFAKGINPGAPPAVPPLANRTDSFGFSEPGRYLVICNVRGHFIDGMYAYINVVEDEGNNGHHK